jgi:hypothetical protein
LTKVIGHIDAIGIRGIVRTQLRNEDTPVTLIDLLSDHQVLILAETLVVSDGRTHLTNAMVIDHMSEDPQSDRSFKKDGRHRP